MFDISGCQQHSTHTHTKIILIKFAWSLFLDLPAWRWEEWKGIIPKKKTCTWRMILLLTLNQPSLLPFRDRTNVSLMKIYGTNLHNNDADLFTLLIIFQEIVLQIIFLSTLFVLRQEWGRREKERKSIAFATHFRDCIRYRCRRCCCLFHEKCFHEGLSS